MLLSVVIPCYNEGDAIHATYERVSQVLKNDSESQKYEYEMIFVDDGSHDNTLKIIKTFCADDTHAKYISFSRNFGKESAMLAGLTYASGDCVVIMDADLQHPPELIPEMIGYYQQGYDQVIAKRNRHGDKKTKSISANLYYKMVNKMVDVNMPDGVGDFRLLSRKAINALLSMDEYNRFSKGLFSWIGFKQKIIEYENAPRVAGETKWSFRKLLSYGINGIISFNNKPLRICFAFGGMLILISLIYIIWTLATIIYHGISVPGYFTTIVAILIIGGVQLISIGVIGEYIGKIYFEVKKRPHYLINSTNLKKNKK